MLHSWKRFLIILYKTTISWQYNYLILHSIVQIISLCYSNSGDITTKVNRNIDLIILNILNVNDYYGYEIVKLAKEISNGSIILK